MLSEEQKNEINRALALGYTINSILCVGLKKVMSDIDTHGDVDVRIYFRSLVDEAIKEMKTSKMKIKK